MKYRRFAKNDTFIGKYLYYMSVLETAEAYDFWTAVWLMSIAVGRRTYVDRPRIPVYLNWYVILVAESGLTRKSTAVNTAVSIAHDFLNDDPGNTTVLYQDKATPEQFELSINMLSREHGHAHIALGISELVRFLGKERYKMALPGLLTDLYDCPSYRRGPGTIAHGDIIMRDVFVTGLFASTASWFVRAINPDVIEGGFTSRVMHIHSEARKRAIPWPEKGDVHLRGELLGFLHHMRECSHKIDNIKLSPNALAMFKRWYSTKDTHTDPFNASWDSREDEHVLRLAATLAINDDVWNIHSSHIKSAIEIIHWVRVGSTKLFDASYTRDKTVVGIERLRSFLIQRGMELSSQTEVQYKIRSYLTTEELHHVLNVMHELQMVQRFSNIVTGAGRPKTMWRATELLVSDKAMQAISEALGMVD